jgi:ubiquinone/menaquinone biosynthesis C-methylase UbiE
MAVVLCHELYRFLYPIEPYAKFMNDRDPVGDAGKRVRSLIDLGTRCRASVTPYELAQQIDGNAWQANALEKSTSNLYSELWKEFDHHTLTEEAVDLLKARVPPEVISRHIAGRRVLDMGCGSGRYTLALARLGAASACGVDVQAKSFQGAAAWAGEHDVHAEFREADVLNLPFPSESFDFVLCNGVIHHSASIARGLKELARVLKPDGAAFLYLYAAGGIFWNTRRALREVFRHIPLAYTKMVLQMMGMPSNRFIFCDTWYVPVETHTTTGELQTMLEAAGLAYRKVPGRNAFDLDGAIDGGSIPGAREMWGDGEHRYMLRRV